MSARSLALTMGTGRSSVFDALRAMLFPSTRAEKKLAALHEAVKEANESGAVAADAFERLAGKDDPWGSFVHDVKGARLRERIRRGED